MIILCSFYESFSISDNGCDSLIVCIRAICHVYLTLTMSMSHEHRKQGHVIGDVSADGGAPKAHGEHALWNTNMNASLHLSLCPSFAQPVVCNCCMYRKTNIDSDYYESLCYTIHKGVTRKYSTMLAAALQFLNCNPRYWNLQYLRICKIICGGECYQNGINSASRTSQESQTFTVNRRRSSKSLL
jgi:hypothetical protein